MTREGYTTDIRNIIKEECKKGNHELEKIYETGGDMFSIVVRWCKTCGSIVVDTNFDGRTNPGAITKMKSPRITKALS